MVYTVMYFPYVQALFASLMSRSFWALALNSVVAKEARTDYFHAVASCAELRQDGLMDGMHFVGVNLSKRCHCITTHFSFTSV